jgi:hypothetical protein
MAGVDNGQNCYPARQDNLGLARFFFEPKNICLFREIRAAICESLIKTAGGFNAGNYYWSSTENNTNNAWNQNFSNGTQNNNNKTNTNYVRCVRRLSHRDALTLSWSVSISIKTMNDFTLEDLFLAYYDCRRHKRNTANALKFEVNLEQNIVRLYQELKNGTYQIGRSICFVVKHPKIREIWAADFRDRIVHHLVCNFIRERFEKSFIADTYSCIKNRGTLAACHRLEKFSRSIMDNYQNKAYFLKADIKSFFIHKS